MLRACPQCSQGLRYFLLVCGLFSQEKMTDSQVLFFATCLRSPEQFISPSRVHVTNQTSYLARMVSMAHIM